MNNSMQFEQFEMLIEDEIKGLMQTKQALEKQLAHLFNKGLANQNALKQERLDRFRDIFKLSNKLLEMEDINLKLQRQVNAAEKLKIQNAGLVHELSEHKARIANFEKEAQQHGDELRLCQQQIKALEEKNIQSDQRNSSLSNQLTQLKTMLENSQQQLHQYKTITSTQKALLSQQHTKSLQQICELKTLNNQLQSKLQLLQQQNLQWKHKHQQSLDALKQHDSNNASQLSQLKNQLISKQCELKTLSQQILQANKAIDAMNHESKKLYTQLDQLKEQDIALKSTLDNLNRDLKMYKDKNLGLTKMNKELIETIEKLRGKRLKTQTAAN